MPGDVVGIAVGVVMLCTLIGGAIGNQKGRPGVGLVLGFFLGFIGIIVIAILEPTPEVQALRIARTQQVLHTLPGMSQSPAAWWPDPHRRHEHRYWDGARWTEHVSDQGRPSIDHVGS